MRDLLYSCIALWVILGFGVMLITLLDAWSDGPNTRLTRWLSWHRRVLAAVTLLAPLAVPLAPLLLCYVVAAFYIKLVRIIFNRY